MWPMPEVLVELDCSELALRDAFIAGRITPSYYAKGGLWAYDLDSTGKPRKREYAVFKNQWMYAVRFKSSNAWDGYFVYLADTVGPFGAGSVLFSPTGSSMASQHVVHLRDVLTNGAVTAEEIDRFKSSAAVSAPTTISSSSGTPSIGKAPQWWNIEYELLQMAAEEKAKRTAGGFGMVQRGSRAGKHPLKAISEALSRAITLAEKSDGRSRGISAKSIEIYLRERGGV